MVSIRRIYCRVLPVVHDLYQAFSHNFDLGDTGGKRDIDSGDYKASRELSAMSAEKRKSVKRILLLCPALFLCMQVSARAEEGTYPESSLAGARVFVRKGCVRCHSVMEGQRDKVGPDLGKIHTRGNMLDVVGRMWSHGPLMMGWLGRGD